MGKQRSIEGRKEGNKRKIISKKRKTGQITKKGQAQRKESVQRRKRETKEKKHLEKNPMKWIFYRDLKMSHDWMYILGFI